MFLSKNLKLLSSWKEEPEQLELLDSVSSELDNCFVSLYIPEWRYPTNLFFSIELS